MQKIYKLFEKLLVSQEELFDLLTYLFTIVILYTTRNSVCHVTLAGRTAALHSPLFMLHFQSIDSAFFNRFILPRGKAFERL
jgi:hypothetical protein